mgnify:CR=1 FL=1|tara:strand:- start:217 stop:1194 length:978 start_codon:yes stop_codon:yes gene_type:complete
MKLIEDLKTAIQKDKKKGVFLLIALLVISFGIFKAVTGPSEEPLIVQKKKVEALPMPDLFDSTEADLDKATAYQLSEEEFRKDSMLKNSYDLSEDNYFSNLPDDEIDQEQQNKNNYNESFNDVFGKSSNTSSQNKTQTTTNYKTTSTKGQEPVVETNKKRTRIPRDNGTMANNNSYSSSDNSVMINAVVSNGNKPVKSGSTIRVRLSENCFIGGIEIPKNTLLSGICSFTSERVKIKINSIRYNNKLIATNYSVYEMDGIEGVYIPGGIKSEIVKDGVNKSVDEGGAKVNTPIGTFGVSSLNKGVNDPSVLIRDGHKIILRLNKK